MNLKERRTVVSNLTVNETLHLGLDSFNILYHKINTEVIPARKIGWNVKLFILYYINYLLTMTCMYN